MKKKTRTKQRLNVKSEKVRSLTTPVTSEQLKDVAGGWLNTGKGSTCDLCPTVN
jgi:hypothetical protein